MLLSALLPVFDCSWRYQRVPIDRQFDSHSRNLISDLAQPCKLSTAAISARAKACTARQSRQQLGETKPAVETVGSFGQIQITPRVLSLTHGVVAATDRPLDVAKQHVDPAFALDLGGGTTARSFQHGVRMIQFNHTPKASQPVAENLRAGRQSPLALVGERGVVEAAHRLDHGEGGVLQRLVRGHRNDERLLVLRAASRLAAVAFAAEVGVVDLHETRKLARFLAFGHHLHDLLLELPRRVVAHTPRCRFSSCAAMLVLLPVSRCIARNHLVSGSLLPSNTVPLISVVWWRQARHW